MHIRSIEPRDRDFFLSRNAAFYRSSACDHAIPPQNAERTFELLLHGTPYADCLIAEDDDGAPCAYLLLALTWSNSSILINPKRVRYSSASRFLLKSMLSV